MVRVDLYRARSIYFLRLVQLQDAQQQNTGVREIANKVSFYGRAIKKGGGAAIEEKLFLLTQKKKRKEKNDGHYARGRRGKVLMARP